MPPEGSKGSSLGAWHGGAEDPANAFDPVNVRDTWFSASHYFRRVDEYIPGDWDKPLINTLWNKQATPFYKAIAALPIPGQRIQLPATDARGTKPHHQSNQVRITIPAPRPISSDPTPIPHNRQRLRRQEDSYHYFVSPLLARGWNFITYEGPRQPAKSSVVDTQRVVCIGNLFGGYLAARRGIRNQTRSDGAHRRPVGHIRRILDATPGGNHVAVREWERHGPRLDRALALRVREMAAYSLQCPFKQWVGLLNVYEVPWNVP
ncbi:hypothetical protein BJX64DRAFT_284017 [Aspergillus heterothallicus]